MDLRQPHSSSTAGLSIGCCKTQQTSKPLGCCDILMASQCGSHGAHVLLHVPCNIPNLLLCPSYLLWMACLGCVANFSRSLGYYTAKLPTQGLFQGFLLKTRAA